MENHEHPQNQLKESDNFPDILSGAFGIEVILVIILVLWNHNTVHPGGWQDLAIGVIDIFILGGTVIYSSLWIVAALIKLVMYRLTAKPMMGTAARYRYGIALHCVAIFASFSILVSCL